MIAANIGLLSEITNVETNAKSLFQDFDVIDC